MSSRFKSLNLSFSFLVKEQWYAWRQYDMIRITLTWVVTKLSGLWLIHTHISLGLTWIWVGLFQTLYLDQRYVGFCLSWDSLVFSNIYLYMLVFHRISLCYTRIYTPIPTMVYPAAEGEKECIAGHIFYLFCFSFNYITFKYKSAQLVISVFVIFISS